MEKLLIEDTKIDAAARLKLSSSARKIITEVSQEWDIFTGITTTMSVPRISFALRDRE